MLHLFPFLSPPDRPEWERHFPNGVGNCIFSSPGFQRLMAREMGPSWRQCLIRAQTKDGKRLSVPVFARAGRWNRVEITVRPIPYCVAPVEAEEIDEEIVRNVLAAVQAPFTAGFSWWLPPGFIGTWTGPLGRPWLGHLDVTFTDAYIVTLEGSVRDHFARYVHRSQQERIRATYRRGLEVIDHPAPEMIDEYYRLYLRVWEEEKWSGYKYPDFLIHGVANGLGDGGKVYLMRYKGNLVGGGALLFDRHTVTYFHGAMDRRFKEVFPHYVLFDLAFKEAEARGLRYIDLGCAGPENEGLKFFKKSWGAVPTPIPVLRWRFDGPAPIRKILAPAARISHYFSGARLLRQRALHEA